MQALTGEATALGLDAREMGEAPTVRFALNADAPMGTGKLAAQVGHAVLIAAKVLGPRHGAAFDQWLAAGTPCVFARADREAWGALRAGEEVAVVRDAGLTEVAPGTETVMALPPSLPSTWGPVWRALPRV
ncbi:MAG: peptidyl-tRNA hydrolase [Polyangiales bacterium]